MIPGSAISSPWLQTDEEYNPRAVWTLPHELEGGTRLLRAPPTFGNHQFLYFTRPLEQAFLNSRFEMRPS